MSKSCHNYNHHYHHHRDHNDDDDDDHHHHHHHDQHMFDANDYMNNFSSGNSYPANKISGFIDDNKVNLSIVI